MSRPVSPPGRRPAPRLRGVSVWLIALLVALVATVQIRSQAEVVRSLSGTDAASLAFLIDDLHRANDVLSAETSDLTGRRAALQSGSSAAADEVLVEEAQHLRAIEGLIPVHGPGVVIVIDASGLGVLDLQDAINNLGAGGGEALEVNGHRMVAGTATSQSSGSVTIDGAPINPPWTISVIGDPTRLAEVAQLMTQQLRADRRVRQATYRVESDLSIRSVISERPFVYAVDS
ncbi:MAG TPA: DUF881 domain-containing protein [Patescibacteria group bacterium]|nr:DUF881 domain-containing protein [Patescibacteria group bacterium]